MAYYSWKDIADITFASTDLKAYVIGISGLAVHATKQEFHPAGVAWPTPLDTGLRQNDDVVINFMYDGSATGPAVKCAMGTSSTFTCTLASGQSITGTFWVSDVEATVGPDQDHQLNITLTPSGTITWDVTA